MGTTWAAAFAGATALALVGTPLLRRLALATGFVDHPAERKSHRVPVPYLGGLAIIVGALVGAAFGRHLAPQAGVVAFTAAVLGTVGLLDDDRVIGARPRVAVQVAAAGAVVAVGVRAEVTGVWGVDAALTMLWIVGITNAVNLLDNMDALSSGVTLVASLTVFGLAALAGQEVVGTFAVALAGACLGFLAYNLPPASIFMGDAGALFLGFLLAVATIVVDPAVGPPGSFLVPLLLLALPIADTTTVVLARLRHRRKVGAAATDHLSHRLVARGLSRGAAVGVLVGVEAVLAAVAFAAGRSILLLPWAGAAGAAVLVALLAVTIPARVYPEDAVGLPRWVLGALLAGAGLALLLTVPAGVALARARGPLGAAADAAQAALDAGRNGHREEAAARFAEARGLFEEATRRLENPFAGLGRGVPVISHNLGAARELAAIGETLAAAGHDVVTEVDPQRLRVRDGGLDLDELDRTAPALRRAHETIDAARLRALGIGRGGLLPPLGAALEELTENLTRAEREAENTALAAEVAPAVLGGDGPRRYFLAVQNTAEARATGGFIGNFGELVAEDGRVQLTRFGRIAELNEGGEGERALHAPGEFVSRYGRFEVERTWQNVNVSPDFPTVARVIEDLYPQSGGAVVDGVIAVDPAGLAALLELTGAVEVPGWPEAISAGNVVEVTLRDAYDAFPDEERVEFLGLVANRVWRAVTTADLGDPAHVAGVLGEAVRGRHLIVHLVGPQEQELAERLGVAGRLPPAPADSLLVVNQNAAGNKTDYYLSRDVHYRVRLDPRSGERAVVDVELELDLVNGAPASGLSPTVIGPYDERFSPGENRTFLSVYTPFGAQAATLDGDPVPIESAVELGRRVYSVWVSMPPGSAHTLSFELTGEVALGAGGWYALDLLPQPRLVPDPVRVEVEVARGWRVAETIGLDAAGRRASGTFALDEPRTVWVRLERSGLRGLWDQVRGGA